MVLTNEQRIMYMEVLKLWLKKLNEKDENFILGDLKEVQMQSQWDDLLKNTTTTCIKLVYVKHNEDTDHY